MSDDVDSGDEITLFIDSDDADECSEAVDQALDLVDEALAESCERLSVTRGYLRGDSSEDDWWPYYGYYRYDHKDRRRKSGRRRK